jgi:hypothetical protein
MTALAVHLPNEKHRRLKALAKSRGMPLNRLIDQMTTLMLAEFDVETGFAVRAARGTGQEATGLALLDKAMGYTRKGTEGPGSIFKEKCHHPSVE